MSAESKPDASDRLRASTSEVSPSSTVLTPGAPAATSSPSQPAATAATSTIAGQQDEQNHKTNKTSYSVNKQQMAATALHQHYLNYFNSNISKQEAKSHRARGNIFNSFSQHSQQQAILLNQPEFQPSQANQRPCIHQHHHQNGRIQNQNSPAQIYHIPPTNIPPAYNQNHYAKPNISSSFNLPRTNPKDETMTPNRLHQQPSMNQRAYSTGALPSNQQQSLTQQRHQPRDTTSKISAHNFRQDQLDRDSEETTTIKEELENDLEGYKNSELEAISSLERNLPIELSFLIRQQAHCMAKMNYLDRQIRELKETANHQQQVDVNQVSSTSISNRNHSNRPINNIAAATMTHIKNGNFILSDDSGGEYSRATISDDDELSSLLDQIAKTVRPEQRNNNDNMLINSDSQIQHLLLQQQQQQQPYPQQQRLSTAYNMMNQQQQQQPHQQQQPYTIINPNQLHHQQAVPIFVMSSPIAVAHPSSISSNILPGVHFQPEPRYNQYYEDFYAVNNAPPSTIAGPTASTMQRQNLNPNAYRSQHFDSSISAVEQLVSQKEKRQIISQLKSADNWLKMRTANNSSSLFNQQESSLKNVGNKQATMTTSDETQEQVDVASMR